MNSPFLLTNKLINDLERRTIASGEKWGRICLHQNPDSLHHCMIMCMLGGINSGYHRSSISSEIITYSFLRGDFLIDLQDCEYSLSADNPLISIPDSRFRTVSNPNESPIIYLEHRAGPYRKDSIIWLP